MQASMLFVILSLLPFAFGVSDRSYSNCAVLNEQYDVRLYWTLQSDSNNIDIKIQSKVVNGFTAVGLSTDGTMNSGGGKDFSDAWVMGFTTTAGDKCSLTETSGGCIGDLKITQHAQPAWDENQSLNGVTVGHNTSYIWGEFSRALQTNDTDDKAIPTKGSQYVIYSLNPSFTISWGKLTSHTVKGATKIDFGGSSTCLSKDSTSSTSSEEYSSTGESYSDDGTTGETTGETTGDDDITSSTSSGKVSTSGSSTSGSTPVSSGATSSSDSIMVYLVTMDITSTISVSKDTFSTAMSIANKVASDRIVIVSFSLTNTTARAQYHYQTEFYYKDQPNGPSSQSLATQTQSLANTTLTPEITINTVSVKYTSVPNSVTASGAVFTTISAILVAAIMIFSI